MHISPTNSSPITTSIPVTSEPKSNDVKGFGAVITKQLMAVNDQQIQADQAVEMLATGQTDDVNSVVLQMAKADLTFRLALELRNKLVESYQEIARLQV